MQDRLIVADGELWVHALTANESVQMAARECDLKWKQTIADQAEHHAREIDNLNKRIVEEQERRHTVQLQWQAAEERCGKLDRAEEAMREYEQTIGDQQREIERLKVLIPPKKPSRTRSKTAPHPYSIEATAQQLAERLKKVNKSTI